jgi:SAM-dependent methyltransferase
VIGADIDPDALQFARQKQLLRPLQVDLWQPLPFRSDMFDLVLAGEILEHMPFPERLVAEIARVLRSGGAVVGSVPNAFRLKNRLVFLAGREYEYDPTHLRRFSPESLRHLLESHLDSVEIHPHVGKFAWIWPRMIANDLVWRAWRAGRLEADTTTARRQA